MAFDWEYFAKEGMSPAVKMYQDYITGGINSQVEGQKHQQRMQKAQYDAQIESKQAKEDYEYKKLLEDTKHTHARQIVLDKYTSSELLELLRNKNKQGQLEYGRGTDIVVGKIKQKAAEYSNFSQKDVALFKKNLEKYGMVNPGGLMQIKQVNLVNGIQQSKAFRDIVTSVKKENDAMLRNPDYIDLLDRELMTTDEKRLTTSEQVRLSKFRDRRKKNLEKIQTGTASMGQINEGLFRGVSEYQIGDPVPLTPQQVQDLNSFGIPVPQGKPNPKAVSMSDHIEFIRKSVKDNRGLPNKPDDTTELLSYGLDLMWLERNWKIYTQFFTTHPNYTVKELFELLGRKK